MNDSAADLGEDLFDQIVQCTEQLEQSLATQNWQQAAKLERQRYTMLEQLVSMDSNVTKSVRYTAFLRQALDFIKTKQPQLETELARYRHSVHELGQQRVGASKYRDVFVT